MAQALGNFLSMDGKKEKMKGSWRLPRVVSRPSSFPSWFSRLAFSQTKSGSWVSVCVCTLDSDSSDFDGLDGRYSSESISATVSGCYSSEIVYIITGSSFKSAYKVLSCNHIAFTVSLNAIQSGYVSHNCFFHDRCFTWTFHTVSNNELKKKPEITNEILKLTLHWNEYFFSLEVSKNADTWPVLNKCFWISAGLGASTLTTTAALPDYAQEKLECIMSMCVNQPFCVCVCVNLKRMHFF